MTRRLPPTSLIAIATGLCFLGGCAKMMAEGPERDQILRANALEPGDPLEASNRTTLDSNVALYRNVQKPLTSAYQAVVPAVIRDRITSGISNLEEPRIFVNDLLQLRPDSAFITLGRFVLNSSIGIGGLFDIATEVGIKRQSGDFGETLYTWGVASGPYVVLPVIGPSTVRDAFGRVVDDITSPAGYGVERVGGLVPSATIGAFDSIKKTEDFDEILTSSLDVYPRLRSFYLQKRAAELSEAVGITITSEMVPVVGTEPATAATPPPKPPQSEQSARPKPKKRKTTTP
jgi:phospholipid-binding lipoprotein MlaA